MRSAWRSLSATLEDVEDRGTGYQIAKGRWRRARGGENGQKEEHVAGREQKEERRVVVPNGWVGAAKARRCGHFGGVGAHV